MDAEQHNVESTQRIMERGHFYFLALTFTLLGLAVETAEFHGFTYRIYAELGGWIALAISGITGFYRTDDFISVYASGAEKENARKDVDALGNVMRGGRVLIEEEGEIVSVDPMPLYEKRRRQFDNASYSLPDWHCS